MSDSCQQFKEEVTRISKNISRQGKREYTLTSRASNGNALLLAVNNFVTAANSAEEKTAFEEVWRENTKKLRYAFYALNISQVIPSNLPTKQFQYYPPQLRRTSFPIDPEISGSALKLPIVVSADQIPELQNLSRNNIESRVVLYETADEMAAPRFRDLDFIKQFNGEREKIKSFVSSVRLAVAQYPDHTNIILDFVKARLDGEALATVEDCGDVDELLVTLQGSYDKPEAVSVVSAELAKLQPMRNKKDYIEEVKRLTGRLKLCHIAAGVQSTYATQIAEQGANQSIYANCNDKRLKTILAGKIDSTLDEVVAIYNREFNPNYVFRKSKFNNKYKQNNTKYNNNNGNKNFNRNDNYNRGNDNQNRSNNQSNNRNNNNNNNNRRNNNNNNNGNGSNNHYARPLTGNDQSSQGQLASINQ